MSLFHEIVRCPNVQQWFSSQDKNNSNPCAKIIGVQDSLPSHTQDNHHVPEPWSGDLQHAPILFLSSNPSIDENEEYPLASWSDEWVEDYFTNRFHGGHKQWIQDDIRSLKSNGTWVKVSFWIAVRQRAKELFQREVVGGTDYTLTEVVHCKSLKQDGVNEALPVCVNLYLRRILAQSGAKVIVILGAQARDVVKHEFNIPENEKIFGPIRIGEYQRYIAFLPHPNARGYRSFKKCLTNEGFQSLREYLQNP